MRLTDDDEVVEAISVSGELESELKWFDAIPLPNKDIFLPTMFKAAEPVVDEDDEEDDEEEITESSGGVEADDDDSMLCELSRGVASTRRLLSKISSDGTFRLCGW